MAVLFAVSVTVTVTDAVPVGGAGDHPVCGQGQTSRQPGRGERIRCRTAGGGEGFGVGGPGGPGVQGGGLHTQRCCRGVGQVVPGYVGDEVGGAVTTVEQRDFPVRPDGGNHKFGTITRVLSRLLG